MNRKGNILSGTTETFGKVSGSGCSTKQSGHILTIKEKDMNSKIDTRLPILVTASEHGEDYVELKLTLTSGEHVIIPMLIGTAKGIGVTLTEVADGLQNQQCGEVTAFDITRKDLN
jgi:hypothetical protein